MKKIDKLRAYWSKREDDIMFHWPGGTATKCDGHYLCRVFTKDVLDELKNRGYDLTTIRFSIEPQKGNQRFTSQRNTP